MALLPLRMFVAAISLGVHSVGDADFAGTGDGVGVGSNDFDDVSPSSDKCIVVVRGAVVD